jgi:hypothetical protein
MKKKREKICDFWGLLPPFFEIKNIINLVTPRPRQFLARQLYWHIRNIATQPM